jgi:poly-gamma-glutamate biosynthesis protein PgsC/CapC
MIELLPVSIGVGLGVSLLLSEIFGLTAGGLVVPGYLALYLTKPFAVLLTVGAGFFAFALVHILSSVTILYGRRRIVLLILVGYLTGIGTRFFIGRFAEFHGTEFTVIGFIIPGLIAIWLDRRGILETLGGLIITSVIVRLFLVLLFGKDLNP